MRIEVSTTTISVESLITALAVSLFQHFFRHMEKYHSVSECLSVC